MRLWRFLALLPLALACQTKPTPAPAVLLPEPPSASAAPFHGCDMSAIPDLAILSKQVLVDGLPVDGEAGLESTLNAKQELNAMIGGDPIKDIVVQVGPGVSEQRVERLLARARSAGFVNATRLSPPLQQDPQDANLARGKRRPTSR